MVELFLEMAAAGLPKSGRIGFEIFDKANFGATEFVEHINYRRALEGELERSIMGMAEVEQARVHITFPKDSVFLEARQAAKASVMLKLQAFRPTPLLCSICAATYSAALARRMHSTPASRVKRCSNIGSGLSVTLF
jgi:hypothetical protein